MRDALDEYVWSKLSPLMALIYNVNRGKGRARGPDDFNPYRQRPAKTLNTDKEIKDFFEGRRS